MVEAIARVELVAADLIRNHPPAFSNPHKRMLFEKVPMPITGTLHVSRWRGELPRLVESTKQPALQMVEDIFSYPPEEPGAIDWHLNFADAELFGYYSGPLLAQDEHQVLEHPVLGSLRDALTDLARTRPELAPRTRDQTGPTPYLVRNAQRCLSFDTINGPYGMAFANAGVGRILGATTFLEPPTFSNILAMVAPPGGHGRYERNEIADILRTAFVGFSTCREESGGLRVVVHTGNWGCGAFGGNPVLMAFLQLCAARLAAVDEVVYHTFSSPFSEAYRQALSRLDEIAPGQTIDTEQLIDRVDAMAFRWGVSDGN
jgi:hypothetical protein